MNVAVTLFAASIVTTQAPVPEHALLQPANDDEAAGVAANVTSDPSAYDAEHAAPQRIPAGAELTEPEPEPVRDTLRVNVVLNDAPTLFAASIVTEHAPVPEHAPVQPSNTAPGSGDGVSVTTVPPLYVAAQVEPQKIPSGDEVTVPGPVRVTDSRYESRVNVAVTAFAASIVRVQAPLPVHAPLQPANDEVASGVAVSVTSVPYP